ncbi:MAG: hypothetical protein WED09_04860 [Homoserinimonas sp.]
MEGLAVFALVVAVIAVVISSWHGLMAEEQLRLSRLTEAETRRTLEQIRREMTETRRMSNDLADKINERITKVFDSNAIAESQGQALEQALSEMLEQSSPSPPAEK